MAEPETAPAELTEAQLAEIEARCAAATPGPWRFNPAFGDVVIEGENYIVLTLASAQDGPFAAHARTDVPALVAEVRRLHAALLAAAETPAPSQKVGTAPVCERGKETGDG